MTTSHELVGQRVYYTENGPKDTGTIISARKVGAYARWWSFEVKWDNGDPTDEYTINQLTFI